MKFIFTISFSLFSLSAFCNDNIIDKLANIVCECIKENTTDQQARPSTSYISCTTEQLKPYKKSLKKLFKKIIREDNKGEELNALDAFYEDFEIAMRKNCPDINYKDYTIFNDLWK